MRHVICFKFLTFTISIDGIPFFFCSEKPPLRLKGEDISRVSTFSTWVCELFIVPRLLTNAKQRLGRRTVMEFTDHPLVGGVGRMLQYSYILEFAPTGLHLPQFAYTEPKITTNFQVL
jgi:hypothetical protein